MNNNPETRILVIARWDDREKIIIALARNGYKVFEKQVDVHPNGKDYEIHYEEPS